jgi:organic radical activating enzyme
MTDLVLATDDAGEPEIFASLQGEGPSAGRPVAFIRLSRCNLACTWCDTAYTWRFEGDNREHRDGVHYDRRANQVKLAPLEAAERVAAMGQNRLVITGGEPLMQGGALAEMLEHLDVLAGPREGRDLPDGGCRLRGSAPFVEIETNGTTKAPPRLDIRIDQYNVSPKLAHSGNAAKLALIPERLAAYAADPRAFFKFVIAKADDVDEVLGIVSTYGIPSSRVFLMAEGTTSEAQRERQAWLSGLALKHGFRMSDRLHIHLYGDTRGT